MFFYLSKPLFLSFRQFKGKFVPGQTNSKYVPRPSSFNQDLNSPGCLGCSSLSAYPTPFSSATQAWHGKMRCSPLTALFNITSSTYQSDAGPRPSWPTRSFSIYKTKEVSEHARFLAAVRKGARVPPARTSRRKRQDSRERW